MSVHVRTRLQGEMVLDSPDGNQQGGAASNSARNESYNVPSVFRDSKHATSFHAASSITKLCLQIDKIVRTNLTGDAVASVLLLLMVFIKVMWWFFFCDRFGFGVLRRSFNLRWWYCLTPSYMALLPLSVKNTNLSNKTNNTEELAALEPPLHTVVSQYYLVLLHSGSVPFVVVTLTTHTSKDLFFSTVSSFDHARAFTKLSSVTVRWDLLTFSELLLYQVLEIDKRKLSISSPVLITSGSHYLTKTVTE